MESLENLHFAGTVWRPPHEALSVLLQVTIGCSHHSCRFCSLYDDLRFGISPMEEIEHDLRIIAQWAPRARRVFLVGANPFVLSYGRLVRIADRIRDFLPKVETIGMFARVSDIGAKSDDELRELRSRGITGLTIGTETGDAAALAYMNKGVAPADILRECRRLDVAGIEYSLTYMTGLSGAGLGVWAARATAELYNLLNPRIIGIVSLTVFPESRLWRDVGSGAFREAGERERLEELREFLSRLDIPTVISANTVSNLLPQFGHMPDERRRLLFEIECALSSMDDSTAAGCRRSISHL